MKYLQLTCIILISFISLAQNEKTVSLVASGTGKSKQESIQNALRSAIEQSFGAFISSQTELLNEELIRDEIVMLSAGNIQKYEIISEIETPTGDYVTSLNAIVSINNLSSFVESKGIKTEFKGGLFAVNIKQQKLNETSEITALSHCFQFIHEGMQNSFDFKIIVNNPISIGGGNEYWKIPLQINVLTNDSYSNYIKYFVELLKSISLTPQEVQDYKTLNKSFYPINLIQNNKKEIYYLRSVISFKIVENLCKNWEFYLRNFNVNYLENKNLKSSDFKLGEYKTYYFKEMTKNNGWNESDAQFFVFNTNDTIMKLYFDHNLPLSEIEKITDYKIVPLGLTSKIIGGGYSVYEFPSKVYTLGIYLNRANKLVDFIPNLKVNNSLLSKGDSIISINGINIQYGDLSGVCEKSQFEDKKSTIKFARNGTITEIEIVPDFKTAVLISSICDIDALPYIMAIQSVEELDFMGFSDWRTPNISVYKMFHQQLVSRKIGNFKGCYYSKEISSSQYYDEITYKIEMACIDKNGEITFEASEIQSPYQYLTRPVRLYFKD